MAHTPDQLAPQTPPRLGLKRSAEGLVIDLALGLVGGQTPDVPLWPNSARESHARAAYWQPGPKAA